MTDAPGGCFQGKFCPGVPGLAEKGEGNLLGLQSMEKCPLNPVLAETREVEKGIVREKVIRQEGRELQDKADKRYEGGELRRYAGKDAWLQDEERMEC